MAAHEHAGHDGADEHGPCGCAMDPDPTVSTGFLPIMVAVTLLGCAVVLGLFG